MNLFSAKFYFVLKKHAKDELFILQNLEQHVLVYSNGRRTCILIVLVRINSKNLVDFTRQ